jgi:anti-sigma-K factor RskA
MSAVNEPLTEFERNARVVLEHSLSRVDARTRSRLNQARHAALEAAGARRRAWWRSLTLVPTAGAAAAALLVAVVLWHRQPGGEPPVLEAQHAAEDMDLLADSEALELLDGWDGPFYEWAAEQTDNVKSDG